MEVMQVQFLSTAFWFSFLLNAVEVYIHTENGMVVRIDRGANLSPVSLMAKHEK